MYVCAIVCKCVCQWVVWKHKLFINRLMLLDDVTTDEQGRRSSVLLEAFLSSQRQLEMYLGLFPLAGIMVPGVIVHLLCISVILPSSDDSYIFYKDIHICM